MDPEEIPRVLLDLKHPMSCKLLEARLAGQDLSIEQRPRKAYAEKDRTDTGWGID
jgi:hypothetical protein